MEIVLFTKCTTPLADQDKYICQTLASLCGTETRRLSCYPFETKDENPPRQQFSMRERVPRVIYIS